jgi:hypothetical protein
LKIQQLKAYTHVVDVQQHYFDAMTLKQNQGEVRQITETRCTLQPIQSKNKVPVFKHHAMKVYGEEEV